MSRTILLLHTSPIVVPDMERAFTSADSASPPKIVHHVDEAILPDLVERECLGSPTDPAFERMLEAAVDQVAPDVIQVTCTSLSHLISNRRPGTDRPPVRAMDAELRRYVAAGRWTRPLVVVTVASTYPVTTRYLAVGQVPVRFVYTPEAFAARASGDVTRHNELLCGAVRAVQHDHDVLLLPQASMYVARDALADALEIPVVHAADEAARALCAG
jgi:hypothetical protein